MAFDLNITTLLYQASKVNIENNMKLQKYFHNFFIFHKYFISQVLSKFSLKFRFLSTLSAPIGLEIQFQSFLGKINLGSKLRKTARGTPCHFDHFSSKIKSGSNLREGWHLTWISQPYYTRPPKLIFNLIWNLKNIFIFFFLFH